MKLADDQLPFFVPVRHLLEYSNLTTLPEGVQDLASLNYMWVTLRHVCLWIAAHELNNILL